MSTQNSSLFHPYRHHDSQSIIYEKREHSHYKTSISFVKKNLLKVSCSINRGREYSKPIELNTCRNRLFLAFIVILSISIGILQVTQSGFNIALGIWLKSPLKSALVSFIIGDICLLPFYFLCNNVQKTEINHSRSNQRLNSVSTSYSIFNPNTLQNEEIYEITPSMTCINMKNECLLDKKNIIILLNGALGVFFVCSVIYISPIIGFSLYYIAVVIGQIITAQMIDHFGLFWAVRKRLSCSSFIGSVFAITGAIIFQIPGFVNTETWPPSFHQYDRMTIVYVLIAMASGICITFKSTLDRKLKKIMNGSAYQSTFLSFMNSTLLLLIINAVICYLNDDWFDVNDSVFSWWIFLGGLMGPVIVSGYIIAPSYIGFVATFICAIFGSLICSFSFDVFGLFVRASVFSYWELGGMIGVLVGAILVNLRKHQEFARQQSKSLKNYSVIKQDTQSVFEISTIGNKYVPLTDVDEDDDDVAL